MSPHREHYKLRSKPIWTRGEVIGMAVAAVARFVGYGLIALALYVALVAAMAL